MERPGIGPGQGPSKGSTATKRRPGPSTDPVRLLEHLESVNSVRRYGYLGC